MLSYTSCTKSCSSETAGSLCMAIERWRRSSRYTAHPFSPSPPSSDAGLPLSRAQQAQRNPVPRYWRETGLSAEGERESPRHSTFLALACRAPRTRRLRSTICCCLLFQTQDDAADAKGTCPIQLNNLRLRLVMHPSSTTLLRRFSMQVKYRRLGFPVRIRLPLAAPQARPAPPTRKRSRRASRVGRASL
jgi:hypothetical protein